MKRVKNSIKKITNNILAMYAILTLIIIGLIIYIFIDNNGNSNKTVYKQIKVNNDLGDSVACKSNVIRDDVTNIVIKFCGNGEVTILDSSNASATVTETDASATESDTTITESDANDTVTDTNDTVTDTSTPESSTCTKVTTNEETLDIDNVVNFYSSYNYADNSYIYYILTDDGKVYTTTQANIVNKNYEVTAVDGLEDIVDVDEYITFETNTNIYTSDLYAIDKKGELHFLRNIY